MNKKLSYWVIPGLVTVMMSLTNPTHAIYNSLTKKPVFIGTEDECNVEFNQHFNTKSVFFMQPDYYVAEYHNQLEIA